MPDQAWRTMFGESDPARLNHYDLLRLSFGNVTVPAQIFS
jgi:hypothetical protein